MAAAGTMAGIAAGFTTAISPMASRMTLVTAPPTSGVAAIAGETGEVEGRLVTVGWVQP
jgi:hypothetical protein